MFVLCSGKNSNPSGISSFISDAYPSSVPSLYTLIVYSTICPVTTTFVSSCFGCLYLAVVDVLLSKFVVSTSGTLSVTGLSSIFVINFLKAKSNFPVTITSKSSSSSSGSLLSGVESLSSLSSSVISAMFLIFTESFALSFTLNSILISA